MSRSFGVRSFTTRSPIEILPSVISSRPATMRSAVVFPQPEGPTRTTNSPSRISSDRSCTACTSLSYTFSTLSKITSAIRQPPNVECGACGRKEDVGAVALGVVSVERLEPLGEGQPHGRVLVAARETEDALVPRLAQVCDHVLVDVGVAKATARECVVPAAKGDQAPVLVEERGQRLAPRHRPARVLTPFALEPELVAGEQHRHSRRRHLQTDADELALFRPRHRAEAR